MDTFKRKEISPVKQQRRKEKNENDTKKTKIAEQNNEIEKLIKRMMEGKSSKEEQQTPEQLIILQQQQLQEQLQQQIQQFLTQQQQLEYQVQQLTQQVRRQNMGVNQAFEPTVMDTEPTDKIPQATTHAVFAPMDEIEFYSVVWQKYGGKVPKNIAYSYAKRAAQIMEMPTILGNEKEFLVDYTQTCCRIEADQMASKDTANTNEFELVNLPHSEKPEAAVIKISELVIKPELFDGERPRPRRWIQDYNEAIIANGWTNEIAIKYLPTFLTGSAKDWYFTDVKPYLSPNIEWHQVYQLFNENYLGPSDYDGLSRAIENTRQRPGETVSNFIPRFRRLLLLLTPGLPEESQLKHIKDKLRPEYKPLLAFSNPTNLRSLRDYCLRIEAGFTGRRERDEYRTPTPYRSSSSRSPSRPPGRKVTFSPKPSDVTCYNCKKRGHLARDCWFRKDDNLPGRESKTLNKLPKKINLLKVGDSDDEVTDETTQVLTIQNLAPGQAGTRPKFRVSNINDETSNHQPLNLVVGGGKLLEHKVICKDVEVSAIVDTGAYVSVIDESIVNHFNWKYNGPPMSLIGADGKPLKSKGTISLDLEIRVNSLSKRKKHTLAVIKDLTAPMLIGLELMRALEICIDTKNSKLTFLSGNTKTGIRLISDEKIPARTQKIVNGRVNATGDLVEIPAQNETGLLIANAIASTVNNIVPVMVANPLNKPVFLPSNTQLANYEPYVNSPVTNQVVELRGMKDKVTIGAGLNAAQRSELIDLLGKYKEAFSLQGEIGKTDVFQHEIELLPGSLPFAEPLRRRAQTQIEETRRQVKQLMNDDIIEESASPWASAYVLAKKKNGEYRLCIDFRKLNSMTKKIAYPLPNIEQCLETLSGKRYFTQLDFKSGFWQIELESKSRELTAFRTEDGQFQFKRMPFGLTNAPASFQRMINSVLAGLKGMNLQVFIDDICIATKTWREHLYMIERVLQTTIDANLKISASKCVFASSKVKFLGHEISSAGIKQDPDKLKALLSMPAPVDAKGVKRTLGMLSYYRKFVPGFALIAEPLTKLTRKNVDFVWNEEQSNAYKTLIQKLSDNATLVHYNHLDPHLVKTDASRSGVAGMLLQKNDDDWKLVTCCSRRLSSSESNYGITDLEGLALVYTLTKLRPYLLGKHFQVLVDHCSLCVLNKRTPNSARLQRWAIVLSEFDFEIIYTKGDKHCDVDCLSRAPVDDPIDPYLDTAVYIIQPFDRADWITSYTDKDSKDLFQKAFDKENGSRLIDDIIYKGDLIYVPPSKRNEIARLTHCANINAHPGITATVSKLKENYWWPEMRDDVTTVVNNCLSCKKQKPDRTRPGGQMHSFQIFEPGEQVALDLIEKITESSNGNEYIIVAIDMFTRFVDAKAVPDKGAPTLTQFFIEYCGRHGVPHSVLTDNSTTFCNELTKQIMKVFGVEHVKATPYHSQGNAVVERVNQTIEEKIRLVLDDPVQDKEWDSVLPVVLLAINTTYHSSLGCSPYEMTYGKRPPLQDKNLIIKATPYDMYARLIHSHLKECYSTAVAIQTAAQERSRKYFESRRKELLFEVGDSVLIKSPSRSSKLSGKYQGPYKILGRRNDIYTLEEIGKGRTTTRHVSDLRPCKLGGERPSSASS